MKYDKVMAWVRTITLNQYTNKYQKAKNMMQSKIIKDTKALEKEEFSKVEKEVEID